ncbi:MAG TPA: S53 family peptidase, partial [Pseudonocardiaceae bacterium]|nr:S53 family peptidase [Pseudonocardiaceae bacterium]
AAAMGAAFGVAVHDYRSRTGHDFYAAQRQPVVPSALRGEVTQIGRLVDYSPHTVAAPRSGVPAGGLDPIQLVTAYDATDVRNEAGTTTQTVVVFEWGPYKQSDLDAFAKTAGLPRFSPQLFGGTPTGTNDSEVETELDVEVVHAIAPNARLVIVNANATTGLPFANVGLAIGRLFTQVDQKFPGAVWSLSIGWGCDRLYTRADLEPAESAVEKAESHGTSVFDASGDTAGLECKGNQDYSTPPSASDVGVDAVASLPAITSVGGTLLSTDAQGNWAAEEAWDDSSLSQGGAGGVSRLEARPSWQVAQGISGLRGAGHRLVPDVSADADPESGVAIVIDGKPNEGGGTSQAAPIWAGFTVLMDDYLQHHGGHSIGAINPVVYRIAQNAQQPAFHDITLGGDAVDLTNPGYDLVTGLGSPMVDNLVQDILTLQRSGT